jgi:hypothetical protein
LGWIESFGRFWVVSFGSSGNVALLCQISEVSVLAASCCYGTL